MPCSCTLPGFSITCSNHSLAQGFANKTQTSSSSIPDRAAPGLLGLTEGLQEKLAAGEVSPGGSEARQERARHPSSPMASHPPALDQRVQGGLQDWLRGQGQGSLVLCPHYPWYHLDTSTSATSTHSTLVGGDTTPQSDASPGLSAPMAGQKRGRLQAANPQLGLVVPVTSAKPLLGRCHPPVVTQGLKAHAVPAAASPAR